MITKKDLEINNISYTNKDFSQIYPELLDLTKKLTNKWDPQTTDESDPGLVLLKLLAFIGDKNNYNIDKNILENFITSCTQEKSMRDICDRLGYNIGYYKSATCDLSFSYLGGNTSLDELLEKKISFIIKALDTSFISEDNIVYTLLEDIEISNNIKTTQTPKKLMQGELKVLNLTSNLSSTTSNDSIKIQLYNLDDNNRIYFPDAMVAENGIFINKLYYSDVIQDKEAWRKVDNLNDQDLGQRIYKFGYDSSKGFPYIEFPSDISDLIGDGLEIWYLISDGINGYVSSGSLTSINTLKIVMSGGYDMNIASLDESYYSCNNNAGTGSKDPESINEAYNSFKKTIGVFNTLVSCRDYANAIYNHTLNIGENIVSNNQVTDIRTSPNRKLNILQRDAQGLTYYKNVNKNPTKYRYTDLVLHGLKPYNGKIDSLKKYNETFKKLNSSQVQNIEYELDEYKTISHNLVSPQAEEIHHIENRYALKVNISTIYKVNKIEQNSILVNVKNALYKAFNARELDFGEEIPYNSLLEVIKNADTRIKSVVLDDPTITSYIVKGSDVIDANSTFIYNPKEEEGLKIISENILGGRLPLYEDQNNFNFSFDIDLNTLSEIKNLVALSATTRTEEANTVTTLKENETIQIIEDSYVTKLTYPAYVYYALKTNNSGSNPSGDTLIEANRIYKIKQGETLWVYYTNSSDEIVVEEYKEGEVIKSTFDITSKENKNPCRWLNVVTKEIYDDKKTFEEGDPAIIPLYSIGTQDSIEILEKNSVKLNKRNQYCFWYTQPYINKNASSENDLIQNEEMSLIFQPEGNNKYFHILEEGEYFIYPDKDMLNIYVVGSGTKLEIDLKDTIKWPFEKEGDNYILKRQQPISSTLDELEKVLIDESVKTFENSFKWENLDLSKNSIIITESSISTFIEDEKIKISNQVLTSQWQNLKEDIKNELDVPVFKLSSITNAKARVILSIHGNRIKPQQLVGNQELTIYYKNSIEENTVQKSIIKGNEVFTVQIHSPIDSYSDIILRTPKYDENLEIIANTYNYEYSVIKYKEFKPSDTSNIIYNLFKNVKMSDKRKEYSLNLYKIYETVKTANWELKFNLNNVDDVYINVWNSYNGKTILEGKGPDSFIILNFGSNEGIVNLKDLTTEEVEELKNYSIYISAPRQLKLSSWLDELGEKKEDILNEIKVKSDNTFDYLAPLNNSKLITSYTPLYSFFDYNNIYNILTIAKIDFESNNSSFNIVASSRK